MRLLLFVKRVMQPGSLQKVYAFNMEKANTAMFLHKRLLNDKKLVKRVL